MTGNSASVFLGAPAIVLVALGACEPAPERGGSARRPPEERARVAACLPDALHVRFVYREGEGRGAEGWEIEVLQMGSDVRVTGLVRTGKGRIPVLRRMSRAEFAGFWEWMRRFPLQEARPQQDEEAPAPGWHKKLEMDVVLGPTERIQADYAWERPLGNVTWIEELEDRLHALILDYASKELEKARGSGRSERDSVPATHVRRAIEALGDAEAANLPGGSPDAH